MDSLSIIQGIDDTTPTHPNHLCLFDVASEQHGYFTAAQARGCGFGWDLLSYHTRTGRFIRTQRGIYRLRDYPSWWRAEVMEAWLAAGKEIAVVSHASALDLLDLSDVIPSSVHLTVPRSHRYLPSPPGVTIHTTSRPLAPSDLTYREGVRLTNAKRAILDAAEVGTGPEQIEMAVMQAVSRGWATPQQFRSESRSRSRRVAQLIDGALDLAPV